MFFKHFVASLFLTGIALGAPVQLEDSQSCSEVQLVHAAGTFEIGLGLVGTPLARALASRIPGATSHAIIYNTAPEYLATVQDGARKTEQYLAEQSALCPAQRFILSGYSKGSMVLHETNLSDDLKSKVFAILAFGDPYRKYKADNTWPINSSSISSNPRYGSSPSQNVASFCNSGDTFCDPTGASLEAHLAYPKDGSIEVAADFAKARA
ncbi:unnamed protein product [Rhizoctonia solani]|uniref:Cutinase n=1 Tax=Rhizoctonia solani TaxID=456999 RepID=A0A8H3E491_9AGAM|nr:unnamed protein product [Rhizoctonia solani]